MSYELKINPKDRAAARFIGKVRKALITAAIDEKKDAGITQQKIADALGVNKSVINRILRGDANLTLRTVGEIAWALHLKPTFSLEKMDAPAAGSNHVAVEPIRQHKVGTATTQPNTFVRSLQPRSATSEAAL